jgi:hypothetical protein
MVDAAKYTYGRYTAPDILDTLILKNQQLWVAVEGTEFYGALITEIIDYPRKRSLMLHFTGAKQFRSWKNDFLPVIRQFAKDNNCSTIESYGRPGWEKVFKHDGYTTPFVYYELPVESIK